MVLLIPVAPFIFVIAIWVYSDAIKRGYKRNSALRWFFRTWLLLIVFLPLWIIYRPKLPSDLNYLRQLGKILKIIGVFSLGMTFYDLWRVGFPRLEGPEGESWAKVLIILASYTVMGLLSFGILILGNFMTKRFRD